jgi:hypothetical protein
MRTVARVVVFIDEHNNIARDMNDQRALMMNRRLLSPSRGRALTSAEHVDKDSALVADKSRLPVRRPRGRPASTCVIDVWSTGVCDRRARALGTGCSTR